MNIEIDEHYEVTYPFTKVQISLPDEDGFNEFESWTPGTRNELIYPDDCETVADAEGKMVLYVVSKHKPGKFPERVFYTRRWIDPDGKEFGKNNLHIASISKFKRLISGFYYKYRVVNKPKHP